MCSQDEKRPVCATLEFSSGHDIPKLRVPDILQFTFAFYCLHHYVRRKTCIYF